MYKKKNFLSFLLILLLLTSCSFDKVTGLWDEGAEEEKRIIELQKQQESKIEVVKLYSSQNIYSKEIAKTRPITLSKPKKNDAWTMSGLNAQNNTGNIFLSNINNNFLKKKIGKDKFSLSRIMASPIIIDDNIIFTDDRGTIFSISKRGKVYWKKNIYKKVYKKIYKKLTFAIQDDKIYVADNVGFLYAVSLLNGEIIWIKNVGVPFKSHVKIFDNKIYLMNQDNRILCFSIKDGSRVWDIRTVASFIKSQNFLSLAISQNGNLVVLNSSGDLIKIDANRGTPLWSLTITGALLGQDTDFFKASDIVLTEDEVFFSISSSIFSYNIKTGFNNWKVDAGSQITPIIDGQNVFFVTNNGYFLNIDRETGKIIWSTNILKNLKKKKRNTFITGFIMGSGKIYASTLNGYLIVCSANSGKVEYFKKIGDRITSSPIISNGSLYILTEKSRIWGFN